MSKKGTGKFWIGKGTLGKIRENEEIPEGYITDKKMNDLIDQGDIGERFQKVKEKIAIKETEKPENSGKGKKAKVKK